MDMADPNDAVFEILYRTHARHVHAYCLRRCSADEAKDAAADVFVVAWRRISEVPEGDGALPWLYGVARNVISNSSRSRRRRDRLAMKVAGAFDEETPGPEPQVVRNEEHERLVAALETLPEKDREIIRLVEWEGLSREQVADMFFVSRAAIDKRMSRAYKRLARTLGVERSDVYPTPVPAEEGGEV